MEPSSPSPVPPTEQPRIPLQRGLTLALSVLLLLVGLETVGGRYLKMFRPPEGLTADFIQEWLSVRNFDAGYPIYESQFVSGPRHLPGRVGPVTHLEYNAHPPGSVLLALPFRGLGDRDAHFAWNLTTTPLFLLAIGLALRELCAPFRFWHLLPLAAVLVWAEPVFATVAYGQLNFVLAFLLTAGWVCDRRGRPTAAGVFVGLAAGVKLFPTFVFAYFLATGRWKGLIAGVLAAVAVNGIAAGVFGVDAFRDYVRVVLPSLQPWAKSFLNVSASGLWGRLVNPAELSAGPEAFRSPVLAAVGGLALMAGITGAVVWAGWRSRKTGDPDLGWAAAVAALPLVSPIAWQHYYALHVVPLAVLAARLSGGKRYLGWVATAGILLRDYLYVIVFVSKAHRSQMTATPPFFLPLSPPELLLGTGVVTYCGLILLVLAVTLRPSSSPTGAPSNPA